MHVASNRNSLTDSKWVKLIRWIAFQFWVQETNKIEQLPYCEFREYFKIVITTWCSFGVIHLTESTSISELRLFMEWTLETLHSNIVERQRFCSERHWLSDIGCLLCFLGWIQANDKNTLHRRPRNYRSYHEFRTCRMPGSPPHSHDNWISELIEEVAVQCPIHRFPK